MEAWYILCPRNREPINYQQNLIVENTLNIFGIKPSNMEFLYYITICKESPTGGSTKKEELSQWLKNQDGRKLWKSSRSMEFRVPDSANNSSQRNYGMPGLEPHNN
jgi:hypothetical protein